LPYIRQKNTLLMVFMTPTMYDMVRHTNTGQLLLALWRNSDKEQESGPIL